MTAPGWSEGDTLKVQGLERKPLGQSVERG